ncbi:MAG: caspase family protein, partial [Rhodospirillales bacterium]
MRATRWLVAMALAAAVSAGPMGAAVAQSPPGAESRVALVIGNSAYRDAPLKNPANDARAVGARLRDLGFDVVLRENASRKAMGDALAEFTRKLGPGGVALIYYAGHGVQVRGRNYLIPVDMTLQSETDLRFQAVDVSTLTDELDLAQSRVSFLVLDACRNNPFERKLRGAGRGLAAVDAARGTLIAYATAPGSVAADGEGEHGVYTEALLRAWALPGLKAEEVFKRVRIEVAAATGDQPVPWASSSLTGDFVFHGAGGAPAAAAAAPADHEVVF